ncbi:hypothetical protein Misp01_50790 [Microtetraspora sp. NBRC 13810]|nr:hypothetical protein Misp01_50790 [Microtetraspora sp. NBRC 13810]
MFVLSVVSAVVGGTALVGLGWQWLWSMPRRVAPELDARDLAFLAGGICSPLRRRTAPPERPMTTTGTPEAAAAAAVSDGRPRRCIEPKIPKARGLTTPCDRLGRLYGAPW